MEDGLANLNLLDEDTFLEDALVVDNQYRYSLVGHCLTDSMVHFPSLRNTMVDLWHPIGGIYIVVLRDRRYLFQFFNDVDKGGVLMGAPWFFNNHLLILSKTSPVENPMLVPLFASEFWVQIHDLSPGLMSEPMAKQFGNFLGFFLEYDTSIPTMGVQKYMRIRVKLDVNQPLKRRKKIIVDAD